MRALASFVFMRDLHRLSHGLRLPCSNHSLLVAVERFINVQTNDTGVLVFPNLTAGYTYSVDAFSPNHTSATRTVTITGEPSSEDARSHDRALLNCVHHSLSCVPLPSSIRPLLIRNAAAIIASAFAYYGVRTPRPHLTSYIAMCPRFPRHSVCVYRRPLVVAAAGVLSLVRLCPPGCIVYAPTTFQFLITGIRCAGLQAVPVRCASSCPATPCAPPSRWCPPHSRRRSRLWSTSNTRPS